VEGETSALCHLQFHGAVPVLAPLCAALSRDADSPPRASPPLLSACEPCRFRIATFWTASE
jgi:hypothetical protein